MGLEYKEDLILAYKNLGEVMNTIKTYKNFKRFATISKNLSKEDLPQYQKLRPDIDSYQKLKKCFLNVSVQAENMKWLFKRIKPVIKRSYIKSVRELKHLKSLEASLGLEDFPHKLSKLLDLSGKLRKFEEFNIPYKFERKLNTQFGIRA